MTLIGKPSDYREWYDGIGEVETTKAGNVVLRVGRRHDGEGGWQQVAYVVLTMADLDELEDRLRGARRFVEHDGDF